MEDFKKKTRRSSSLSAKNKVTLTLITAFSTIWLSRFMFKWAVHVEF